MGGIAGIILKHNGDIGDLRGRLGQMSAAMRHRGPKVELVYISDDLRLGLVNRRLNSKHRDRAAAPQHPDLWIALDGEVFNLDELRAELETAGHAAKSASVDEIIAHAYAVWGTAMFSRLRGNFSIAIHDNRHEQPRVMIASDHMGSKPLYYCETSDAIVFASELRALLASGLVSREINPIGLVGYLLTGSVPAPHTIFHRVYAFEPACVMRLDSGTAFQPNRYWDLPTKSAEIAHMDESVERVRSALTDAIRIRMVADSAPGLFLSGGLDSAAIAALAGSLTSEPFKMCSVIFEGTAHRDNRHAHDIARAMGAQFSEHVITLDDVLQDFHRIFTTLEQPSIDGLTAFYLGKAGQEANFRAVLSGLGADELFGGHSRTFHHVPRLLQIMEMANSVPMGLQLASKALNIMPHLPGWQHLQNALQREPSLANAYFVRRGLLSPQEAQELVGKEMWARAEQSFNPVDHIAARANAERSDDAFAWITRAELRTHLHHQVLRDSDAASMFHSLQMRTPMLDPRVVSEVMRVPSAHKTSATGHLKPLLAKTVDGMLPKSVTERRIRPHYGPPYAQWLSSKVLRSRIREAILPIANAGMLDVQTVNGLFEKYERREVDWSRIWALASLSTLCD